MFFTRFCRALILTSLQVESAARSGLYSFVLAAVEKAIVDEQSFVLLTGYVRQTCNLDQALSWQSGTTVVVVESPKVKGNLFVNRWE